jgi:hypothetical protein
VRWSDAAGSKVGLLNGLHGFRELWELRRQYRRGRYALALARTRAIAASQARRPAVV